MKLTKLEKHLRSHGCRKVRQGASHTIWASPNDKYRAPVPRHREVDGHLARAICKQLGVKPASR